MPPVNYRSLQCSFQRYLRPGGRYVSLQPVELTTVAFRATTILLTVGIDIPDHSIQSYLKNEHAVFPVNCLRGQL